MKIISNDNLIASTLNSAGIIGITSTGSQLCDDTSDNLSLNFNYDEIFKEFERRYNKKPTFEHKCNNCGATLKLNLDNHIFKCPYCRSVYAIGTNRIEDRL